MRRTRRQASAIESAKTKRAPHQGGLVRDALIQNAFAPDDGAIGYVGTAAAGTREIDATALTVAGDDRSFCLDVVPTRPWSVEVDSLPDRALREPGVTPFERFVARSRSELRLLSAWTVARPQNPFSHMSFRIGKLARKTPTEPPRAGNWEA